MPDTRDELAALIREAVENPALLRDLPDAILASGVLDSLRADAWDECRAEAYALEASGDWCVDQLTNPYRNQGEA